MPPFKDRFDAGRQLAEALREYADQPDVIVLALPRGGVPVAYEVAKAVNVPMDLFLVRKLGVPGHEELAMGAIATGGVRVMNPDVVQHLNVSDATIETVTQRESEELRRREQAYRGDRPEPDAHDKIVILIDDGLATGASMYAAVIALRQQDPKKIVVAVPTAAPETCDQFSRLVNQVVCLVTPEPFFGVGAWYEDFSQTSDEEVRDLLHQSAERHTSG